MSDSNNDLRELVATATVAAPTPVAKIVVAPLLAFRTGPRWFGVADSDLPLVLPNLGRFASKDLGFMG